MSTWRDELKALLEQVGDQSSPIIREPDPLFPVILGALEAVRSEMTEYGIRARVYEEQFHQQGGSLVLVTPDTREIRLSVVAKKEEVSITATHSVLVIPATRSTIDRASATEEAIAGEVVRALKAIFPLMEDHARHETEQQKENEQRNAALRKTLRTVREKFSPPN